MKQIRLLLAMLATASLAILRAPGKVQFANIGEGTHITGDKSYFADAALTSRFLLVKRGTDGDHCAVCGAADDPLGVANDAVATADLTDVPVNVRLFGAANGTIRVVTDGTISDGDYCKAGAAGKAAKASTTDLSFGRALIGTDTSKADGDVIEIVHYAPVKAVF